MTSFDVTGVSALEILDSRGWPTLAVTVTLADGTEAKAGVPSGASTGSGEAVELRDGDKSRYEGRGVLAAATNVSGEIADLLRSRSWNSLAEADETMISLDGTPDKHRLGANATVGVSMALARALAASANTPLWQWLTPDGVAPSLPVPHFNVLNGGVHAPNDLDFQEFMVAPLGAPSMAEAVRAGAEVYAALRRELTDRKLSIGLGDEGGFAPEIIEPEMFCGCWSKPSPMPGTQPAPRRVDRPRPGGLGVPPAGRALQGRRQAAGQRPADRPARRHHR